MKKTIFFASVLALLAACGGGDKAKPASDSTAMPATASTAAPDMSNNPDYEKGLALVGGSDCFTCHKIDDKLTGPSYVEVANKYANAPDTIVAHLANRIIAGGKGVWGEAIMTPHPDVSEADAQAMVKYVLLLKK